MKKYIVSLVMAKTVPGQRLDGGKYSAPDVSIQNVVAVTTSDTPEAAYEKVKTHGKLQYPDHNIVVKVVIEANAADLEY